jgi:hypothetical protein
MPTPLIHQTDLFHPHGDPDDHFDLATVFALAAQDRLSLRGIVIDYPPPRRRGDPALGAVAQLSRLIGVVAPVAVGTSRLMRTRDDTAAASAREDGAAVHFVLDTLRRAEQPVAISVVGGATDIALAGKLEPELFARRCAGIYLNAGSALPNPQRPDVLEYNVELNPAGYAALFDLPCPLYWCPCWHMTEHHEVGRHGTFWPFAHREVLGGLRDDVRKYLLYMFDQEPSHRWLTYLRRPLDEHNWEFFLGHWRNMWSTASLLHAAGLTVTPAGALEPVERTPSSVFRFVPVNVSCADDGRTTWSPGAAAGARRFLFEVTDPGAYASAMAAALRALLRAL